jgi:hypothetical protein
MKIAALRYADDTSPEASSEPEGQADGFRRDRRTGIAFYLIQSMLLIRNGKKL